MTQSLVLAAILAGAAYCQEPAATSSDFHDEGSGITLKLPSGWSADAPNHWGVRQTTIELSGVPTQSSASLYFQFQATELSPAQMEKALFDAVAAKQLNRRQEGLDGYTIRTSECSPCKVSGHPALSCIADFEEGGRSMNEYLTWVRTKQLNVLFFARTPTTSLASLRRALDDMIRTAVIP